MPLIRSIFASVRIQISFERQPPCDGYHILKRILISFPFRHLAFTSLHLSPRPPPHTHTHRSPSIITSLYFLLPAPSCNHNLILCNQFRMKTPPALDMLTHTASKQRSRRHKSSTTTPTQPLISTLSTLFTARKMIFVAPKPLLLSTHASDRKKEGSRKSR